MNEVQSLLLRAADEAGSFSAPPQDALRRRARRQTRLRTVTAIGSVVLLVAALAVGLALRGHRSTPTAHGFDPTLLPGRSGPVVTAAQLANYHWADLPEAPIAERYNAAGVWTGSAMLVWGGVVDQTYRSDGASYDPASRSWSVLPPSPLLARADTAYAWVSGNLMIWGGIDAAGRRSDGARYDPAAGRWTMLPPAPIDANGPAAGYAVGSRFVVTNVGGSLSHTIQAAAYDLDTNSWQRLPDLVEPVDHNIHFAVGLGVGSTLLLWVYWYHTVDTGPGSTSTNSGTDSYALQDGTWFPVALQPRHGMESITPLWTGSSVLLADEQGYCGPCSRPYQPPQPGELIDPATGDRTTIPPRNRLDIDYQPAVWTGGALLTIATATTYTDGADPVDPNRSGAWDPQTGTWTPLPPITFGPLDRPVSVWTGSRLLVWGGVSATHRPSPTGGTEFAP